MYRSLPERVGIDLIIHCNSGLFTWSLFLDVVLLHRVVQFLPAKTKTLIPLTGFESLLEGWAGSGVATGAFTGVVPVVVKPDTVQFMSIDGARSSGLCRVAGRRTAKALAALNRPLLRNSNPGL